MLRTSVLMPQSVYNEGLRDFIVAIYGASLYGNRSFGFLGYIDYELYGGASDVPSDTPYLTESMESVRYTDPTYYSLIQLAGIDYSSMEINVEHQV